MKKLMAVAVVLMLSSCYGWAQTNEVSTNAPIVYRPISGLVTGALVGVTGSTNGSTGVSASLGNFLNATYLYVSTNGHVAVGLGNTLTGLGNKKVEPVTTESIDAFGLPTNKVVDVTVNWITSQLYAPDKTHMGLGAGIYTTWNIGWLPTVFGPFVFPKGLELGVGCEPDIDQTINLRFARKTTVAQAEVQFKLQF